MSALPEAPPALVDHLVQDTLALAPVGGAGSFGVPEIAVVGLQQPPHGSPGLMCRGRPRVEADVPGERPEGWLCPPLLLEFQDPLPASSCGWQGAKAASTQDRGCRQKSHLRSPLQAWSG